jgi:predicted nucleic acid-binding protein
MYLLDINVLLAFSYKEHGAHSRAAAWIKQIKSESTNPREFSSCSIVELGFIRIAAGRTGLAENLTVARADLRRIKAVLNLQLLGDELDGNQLPGWVTKLGQTTDGHLLELAAYHNVPTLAYGAAA